jgi:RNA polymerase sigma factor FliA
MEMALWGEYVATGCATSRDKLLNEHLGLVHHVARQLSRTLSPDLELDELISCGTIGLMKAVDSFDPSRGTAFSTFAAPRIQGAILDELRRQDHVSRTIRKKSRNIKRAREALTRRLGCLPTDTMLAEELDVDIETFWRWESEAEGIHHLPFDAPVTEDDVTPAELHRTDDEQAVEELLNHEEEVRLVREAILELGEQERLVLTLHYHEELNLTEIGKVLDLTGSRISQVRSKAIKKLRERLNGTQELAA